MRRNTRRREVGDLRQMLGLSYQVQDNVSPGVKVFVPLISWSICILFSFLFALAYGMGAFNPGAIIPACNYLWVAVPVLAIGTIMLLLHFKSFTWLPFILHVLPWNVFPWLFFTSDEWLEFAFLLNCPTVICGGLIAYFQESAFYLSKRAERGLKVLGIGLIMAIIAITGYGYYQQSSTDHKVVRRAELDRIERQERLTPVPQNLVREQQQETD
jgi:hypothetical protein